MRGWGYESVGATGMRYGGREGRREREGDLIKVDAILAQTHTCSTKTGFRKDITYHRRIDGN